MEIYGRRRSTVWVALVIDDKLGRIPEIIELSVLRIVQAGLNNVFKHAQVNLGHTSPRSLMIVISDNGRGFPNDLDLSELSSKGHYGLLGINERVAVLGGRLRLQNQQKGGLLIQVEIPRPRVETILSMVKGDIGVR